MQNNSNIPENSLSLCPPCIQTRYALPPIHCQWYSRVAIPFSISTSITFELLLLCLLINTFTTTHFLPAFDNADSEISPALQIPARGIFLFKYLLRIYLGFPHSSVGKESTCNAGYPCSIPGSERSAGEGIGSPLWYSWASLVPQLVKNPPAMPGTWVWPLGWEDLLEKGKTTHSSVLAWRIPWAVQSMGSQRVGHNWETFTFTYLFGCIRS